MHIKCVDMPNMIVITCDIIIFLASPKSIEFLKCFHLEIASFFGPGYEGEKVQQKPLSYFAIECNRLFYMFFCCCA